MPAVPWAAGMVRPDLAPVGRQVEGYFGLVTPRPVRIARQRTAAEATKAPAVRCCFGRSASVVTPPTIDALFPKPFVAATAPAAWAGVCRCYSWRHLAAGHWAPSFGIHESLAHRTGCGSIHGPRALCRPFDSVERIAPQAQYSTNVAPPWARPSHAPPATHRCQPNVRSSVALCLWRVTVAP